ncbi:unnamed protein product [Rhodiola kirilowii]
MYSSYSEPSYDDAEIRRLPTHINQQYVNEYARPRAARHEDYEDELDREYLGGGNQYGQLPRRRDPRRTMRGYYEPCIDEAPWSVRRDEDPMKEFREEMRSMFNELNRELDQQAEVINELREQASQISSDFYEMREEELNEDFTSVQTADASTINARTSVELQQNTETSAEETQETSAGSPNSGKEIQTFNTLIPFPVQVIAPKDNTIDQNELGGELEAKHELEEPTVEHPLATSQQALPEKCKDLGTLIMTRDVDSYILQMGDTRDNGPLAPILGQSFLLATKPKIDKRTCLMSLVFYGKRPNFQIYEDDDRPYTRKRPKYSTFGWKPGWRETRAQLGEGYEYHKRIKKFDLTHPWDPNL